MTLPRLNVAFRALLGQSECAKHFRVIKELVAAARTFVQAALQHHTTE
jgi:hypothetical protein